MSDKGAFAELYRRYWASLYQSAFHLLLDKDSCEDIVQDLFIWLWERRDRLEINTVKTYLHAAVKYKVANYFRDGKTKKPVPDEWFEEQIRHSYEDSYLEVKELQAIIDAFTKQLPDKCRKVFVLSRGQHLSNKQIAQKLSISEKTVENQITTALKKLRISLSRTFLSFLF